MTGIAASIERLSVSFNGRLILDNIYLEAPLPGITVLAGRSGSGKTTLLRALNRLNETFAGYAGSGSVRLDLGNGLENIYPGNGNVRSVSEVRRLAGMVFQTPDVLPGGVLANVTLPLRFVAGMNRLEAKDKACQAIKATGLWQEVEDRLNMPAARLSGGQQQRLCLARALALNPAMLLLDEPTASLDATATASIEELLLQLSKQKPLILVSHNPSQSLRLADRLVLMANGRIKYIFNKEMPDSETLVRLLGA